MLLYDLSLNVHDSPFSSSSKRAHLKVAHQSQETSYLSVDHEYMLHTLLL